LELGLNWVRFHFFKKPKLAKSSIFNGGFAFFELGSFSRFSYFKMGRLAKEKKQKTGYRVGFWKGIGDGDTPSFPFG
jgi:hypothetical protein